MSSINALQAAIVESLGAFAGVKSEIYSGQFDSLGAKRSSVVAPSILVAMMNVKPEIDTGTEEIDMDCQWSAFCIMRHVNDLKNSHVSAHDLAQVVVQKIAFNRFGIPFTSIPEGMNIKPINSRFFIDNGLSVLAVSWKQSVRVGESIWSGGVKPEEFVLGLAPNIGLGNEAEYNAI